MLEFKLKELVEIILVDGGNLPENHAIHLHGHHFAFIGLGQAKYFILFYFSKAFLCSG